MKTYSEIFELRKELLYKFKELYEEIEKVGFENTELERVFDLYVISFMSLTIEISTNLNAMKVHNDFNAYKKYSLFRFKKEFKYLNKYLKDDDFYIKKFTDFFELVNLGDFGRQKVLSRKNLEYSLSELRKVTQNMYKL